MNWSLESVPVKQSFALKAELRAKPSRMPVSGSFKGGPARVLRSSPQFGFTLAGYELLQGLLPMPGEHDDEKLTPRGSLEPVTGLQEAKAPLPHLRCRNALKIINDLDLGFGKMKMPHPEGGSTSWLGGVRGQAQSPPTKE